MVDANNGRRSSAEGRGWLLEDRPLRWLALALGAHLGLAALIVAVLTAGGESPLRALDNTAPGFGLEMRRSSRSADSWLPMAIAYEHHRADPSASLYLPFFRDGLKFQYPPSSLLLLELFSPFAEVRSAEDLALDLRRGAPVRPKPWLGLASQLATLATMLLSAVIFERAVRLTTGTAPNRTIAAARMALVLGLGFTFYPLVQGHQLGQAQVFLNTAVAAAVAAMIVGRPGAAGLALGLCCLIKPPLLLVLLWAVLRRERRLATAFLAVIAVGGAAALLRFGWEDHVDYFRVLSYIGQRGEVYWPNQSFNGLANRLLRNGPPLQWTPFAYADPHSVVYVVTVASSAALAAAALVRIRSRAGVNARLLDFLAVLVVSTMAAPVAWGHHYGILVPVFAASVPLLIIERPLGRATPGVTLAAFLATAGVLLRPSLFVAGPLAIALGAHLLFGALTLVVLLVIGRDRVPRAGTPAV